jgi:predicted RND superfamily exporter protein
MEQGNVYTDLNRSFVSVFINSMLRKPLLVILIFIAVTVAFAWRIPHVSFRTSIYDMVVDSLPETSRYNTFKEIFGSDEIIRIVIRTDDIFTPQNFSVVQEMSNTIEKLSGIKRVISLPVIKKAVEMSGKLDLKKFREMIQPIELFRKKSHI